TRDVTPRARHGGRAAASGRHAVRVRHSRRRGQRDERLRGLPRVGPLRARGEFLGRDPGLPAQHTQLRWTRGDRRPDHGGGERRAARAGGDGRGGRGEAPEIRTPLVVAIVDDDVGGPYTIPPRDVFHQALREAGVAVGQRATGNRERIILVYSEPRSWKGRADLGPRSRAALRRLVPGAQLVVLLGHPRLAAQIPG